MPFQEAWQSIPAGALTCKGAGMFTFSSELMNREEPLVFEYSMRDFFEAQTEVGVEFVVVGACWLGSPRV